MDLKCRIDDMVTGIVLEHIKKVAKLPTDNKAAKREVVLGRVLELKLAAEEQAKLYNNILVELESVPDNWDGEDESPETPNTYLLKREFHERVIVGKDEESEGQG